jgi:hypothetical protein
LEVPRKLRKQGVLINPTGARSVWLRCEQLTLKQRFTLFDGEPPKMT